MESDGIVERGNDIAGAMLFRGVILEGVACSGKSSLLRALLSQPSFVGRAGGSSIVLTEHHTQRVLESNGPRVLLRVQDNLDLLREHSDYLGKVAGRLRRMTRWQEGCLSNPRVIAVIERFHLSHVLNYEHIDWDHVADIDGLLAEIGIRLCLVITHADELRRRICDDRGGAWGAFLTEPGQRGSFSEHPSDEAKVRYFVKQQERAADSGPAVTNDFVSGRYNRNDAPDGSRGGTQNACRRSSTRGAAEQGAASDGRPCRPQLIATTLGRQMEPSFEEAWPNVLLTQANQRNARRREEP
jgi:hypothetical protein